MAPSSKNEKQDAATHEGDTVRELVQDVSSALRRYQSHPNQSSIGLVKEKLLALDPDLKHKDKELCKLFDGRYTSENAPPPSTISKAFHELEHEWPDAAKAISTEQRLLDIVDGLIDARGNSMMRWGHIRPFLIVCNTQYPDNETDPKPTREKRKEIAQDVRDVLQTRLHQSWN